MSIDLSSLPAACQTGRNNPMMASWRHRHNTWKPPMPIPDQGNNGSIPIWPTEIRLHKDRRALSIAFNTGETHTLSAEFLRIKSPSAEVQGHSPDQRKTVPAKRYVQILEVQPVGNYAVRLVFDDMHSTGIYSWDYFSELGRNQEAYWQDYLDELAAKGLHRE
jgi:DUF971 family protein